MRLCREMGYEAEVLYTAFNYFLVAARPRPDADDEDERIKEFEAWRRSKVDQLGAPTKGGLL